MGGGFERTKVRLEEERPEQVSIHCLRTAGQKEDKAIMQKPTSQQVKTSYYKIIIQQI